jgi:putative transposase
VKRNQANYPVATLCRLLGVSTSGHYARLNCPPSARAHSDARLTERIRTLHQRSRGSYGVPRILEDLREEGERVNHKRVARLMRSAGFVGISRRKGFKTTCGIACAASTRSGAAVFHGRAARLAVGSRYHLHVPTLAGFLFLAVVMNVFSRRIVG